MDDHQRAHCGGGSDFLTSVSERGIDVFRVDRGLTAAGEASI